MEGSSSSSKRLKTDISVCALRAARLRAYVYRCNAFLDYMLEATHEERQWVVKHVLFKNYSNEFECVFRGDDYMMIVGAGGRDVIRDVGRDGTPVYGTVWEHGSWEREPSREILSYPWLKKNDTSFSLLTANVITLILMHLHTPRDLYNASRASTLFYKAATAPCLYEHKLPALLARGGLVKPPFYDPLFKPHQYFFALSFYSCKEDGELKQKWLRHMRAEGNVAMAVYCRNTAAGWGWRRIKEDEVTRVDADLFSLSTGMLTIPLLDEDGLHLEMDGLLFSANPARKDSDYFALRRIKDYNLKTNI